MNQTRLPETCLGLWPNQLNRTMHTWMRHTLQILIYQTDLCVTEQYGVAYCCSWIPKCLAILLIGEVKIVNNKGPRTEPCGTPEVQNVGSDRAVPIPTCLLRSPR